MDFGQGLTLVILLKIPKLKSLNIISSFFQFSTSMGSNGRLLSGDTKKVVQVASNQPGDELEAAKVLNSPNVNFMFFEEKTPKIFEDLKLFL